MNKSLFEQYAKLKLTEQSVKEQLDELKPAILSELATVDDQAVELEAGVFSVVKRKRWSYTDKVKTTEQVLKELKAEEEAKGIATFVEDRTVMFRGK